MVGGKYCVGDDHTLLCWPEKSLVALAMVMGLLKGSRIVEDVTHSGETNSGYCHFNELCSFRLGNEVGIKVTWSNIAYVVCGASLIALSSARAKSTS